MIRVMMLSALYVAALSTFAMAYSLLPFAS